MKRFFIFLIALVFAYSGFSQVPEKMSYQAVIRNSSDEIIKSSTIGTQISILQGSESGTPIYVETHSTSTNINGLATIEIGGGTPVIGTFSDIDWSTGIYFLKTETDPAGGTGYSITGTSQILSIPYALHAKSAENITGEIDYTEVDPFFTTSQASNITVSDITNLSNLSGTNTGDQELSSYATKDMGNENITNLADPVDDLDAVNKAYVDILESKVESLEHDLIDAGFYDPTDSDGNTYNVVKIGDQLWMAENLRTTKYRDGSDIPNITDNATWAGLSTGAYCWYNNDINYQNPYGALYNFYAIADNRNICPSGWHVPTIEEWTILSTFLGGNDVAGGKLKETGITHWNSPNTGATNETGFTALPGGARQESGAFNFLGVYGYYWTSSEFNTLNSYLIAMTYNAGTIGPDDLPKIIGFPVRCLKD